MMITKSPFSVCSRDDYSKEETNITLSLIEGRKEGIELGDPPGDLSPMGNLISKPGPILTGVLIE